MDIADKAVPKLRFPKFPGVWRRTPLKSLSSKSISYGIVQTGSPVEDGVKCVRVVDLTKPRIDFDQLITTSEKISQSYKKTILCEDEIMVALRGEIGLVAAVPKELEGSNLTRGIARIAPKKSEVHSLYLLWALRSPEGRKEFHKQVNGSALKEIPIGGLNKIPVQLTTLPEQRKIADFLTAVDGRIEQLIQKRTLLEDYKKGVMQQLFTQAIRFKDDHGSDFPDWEEKKLGEVCSILKGKGISKAEISKDGATPCIRYGELYTDYSELIQEPISRTDVPKKELLLSEANDVVIPASGETHIDIATASCVVNAGIALGGDLNIIRTKLNGVFLAYYLNNACKHAIARVAQGSSVIHLYPGHLKGLSLALPTVDEQTKIADFLSSLDRKIESFATKITGNQSFKKGLLQKMFV